MGLLEKVNAAKQKTEQQLSRGGGGGAGAKWWKPANGANKIRIMPSWAKDGQYSDQFWREVVQHWNVSPDQRGPVMCPKETPDLEGECPICAYVAELLADRTDVENLKRAKEIKAKKAFLINIVDMKDPSYTAADVAEFKKASPDKDCPFEVGADKIQVWACPVSIFDLILGTVSNSGTDITDLTTGHNLDIRKIPHKDPFKTRYEVYPELKPTKASVSDPKLPQLDKVGYVMEHAQLLELLEGGGAPHKVLTSGGRVNSDDSYLSSDKNTPDSDDADPLAAEMKRALGGKS